MRWLALPQVVLWVLGEYGALADVGAAGVLATLGRLAGSRPLSDHVRGYLLTALAKLCAQVRGTRRCPLPPPLPSREQDAGALPASLCSRHGTVCVRRGDDENEISRKT